MNWFDIFVIILLLRTGYIGFVKGLATELYKMVSLCISVAGAFYFYKILTNLVNQYITLPITESRQNAFFFILVLLIVMLVLKFVFKIVQKIMQLGFIKNLDSTAGFAVGLARGILISCLVYVMLSWSAVDYITESIQTKSFSGPYIVKIKNCFKTYLSAAMPK